MKTAKHHHTLTGSAVGDHSFVADTPPKLCRHRRRNSSGRCLDCGMHREPMTASGLGTNAAPSIPLTVRI